MAGGDRRRRDLAENVHRASDTTSTAVENMGVDHRGADVSVTEQFLDRPNIVSFLEEVSGKGMAERVAGDVLFDVGQACRFLDRAL